MIRKELGQALVRANGTSLYGHKVQTWAVQLCAEIDPEAIEFDADGRIKFVYGHFEAHFIRPSKANHPYRGGTHPYTDEGFESGVQAALVGLGFRGKINWSEAGMQSEKFADFDADYLLYEEIFPNQFALARDTAINNRTDRSTKSSHS